MLNGSIDTALAGHVRPKVVFPPICDRSNNSDTDARPGYNSSPRFSTVGRINSIHSVRSEYLFHLNASNRGMGLENQRAV